jgi:hypothetical protein
MENLQLVPHNLKATGKKTTEAPNLQADKDKKKKKGRGKRSDSRMNMENLQLVPYNQKAIGKKTSVAHRRSEVKLTELGLGEPSHSNVSGNHLFYPPKVIKAEHYDFIRFVAPTKDEPGKNRTFKTSEAKKFYCIVCEEEYPYSPGSTNQIIRHNNSNSHVEKVQERKQSKL